MIFCLKDSFYSLYYKSSIKIHSLSTPNTSAFSNKQTWKTTKRYMQNYIKLCPFLRHSHAGSSALVRKPYSPRPCALRFTYEGRRKEQSKHTKCTYEKYVSHVTFGDYTLAFSTSDTGDKEVYHVIVESRKRGKQ